MNCALPPVELSKKYTEPPLLVVMIAWSAVLASKNKVPPPLDLLVMFAFIAELASLNVVNPPDWLMIVAPPAPL